MEHVTKNPRTLRRVLAVAIAGATLGVTGAAVVGATSETPAAVEACRPNERDLLRAAYEARTLEARRPELFEGSPRSRYEDLRRAAYEARKLEALRPELMC